jgi:hypothetical protein
MDICDNLIARPDGMSQERFDIIRTMAFTLVKSNMTISGIIYDINRIVDLDGWEKLYLVSFAQFIVFEMSIKQYENYGYN